MIDVDRTAFGRIAVDEAALTRLVRETAERVEGVHAVRGRGTRISVEKERAVIVMVGVVARAGTGLAELGRNVQERVAQALRTALEPSALRVDVTIEEIAS